MSVSQILDYIFRDGEVEELETYNSNLPEVEILIVKPPEKIKSRIVDAEIVNTKKYIDKDIIYDYIIKLKLIYHTCPTHRQLNAKMRELYTYTLAQAALAEEEMSDNVSYQYIIEVFRLYFAWRKRANELSTLKRKIAMFVKILMTHMYYAPYYVASAAVSAAREKLEEREEEKLEDIPF